MCSSDLAAEAAAPSEAEGSEETPVAAPTVEVVQPEEKSAVPPWLKEIWQQLFPAEEAEPEQAASEEAAEETVPSEAAKSEETPVTAPTVEVAHPEEKSVVPAWLKEIWQQLFHADAPASSEPEPASSEEVLPTSEPALPPEETGIESETEGAAE